MCDAVLPRYTDAEAAAILAQAQIQPKDPPEEWEPATVLVLGGLPGTGYAQQCSLVTQGEPATN